MRIAAVGAVAALVVPRDCAPRAVPIVAFHGTADACVPYEGGTVTCGPVPLPITPAEDNLAAWADHAGCEDIAERVPVSTSVTAIEYDDCAGNAAVVLYRIEAGGHTWPGSTDVPRLGATTHEIDATALSWAFFEQHPLD